MLKNGNILIWIGHKMQQLNILNNKEIKPIKEKLLKQFGYSFQEDYAYLKNAQDKVFIVNKDVARIELKNLLIDKIGLYLGELNETEFRLSKEGAQLLALEAQKYKIELKNIVSFTKEEIKSYFQGLELERDLGTENKLILLEYEGDIFGCAKYKMGKILNFLPKIHRGEVIV